MQEATRPIAMIPSDCFRWQPRVQFIDSFQTREAALNCAFEQGYNLIVERSEGKTVLFDVLDDPEGACTSGLELELLKTEEVIVDPYSEGWTSLMILSMWKLARRLGIAVAGLCVRQVVPLLRQAASRRNRKAFERAVRHAWRRITRAPREGVYGPSWHLPIPASCKVRTFSLSTARIQTRRIALRADAFYHREIVPFCRSAARRCWWSDFALAVRRGWYRHSQGSISDVARCFAAEASVLYTRKVVPFCRSVASRSWWSGLAMVLRRRWSRYSEGSILDAARRLVAEASVLYTRKVVPFCRSAARRSWWSGPAIVLRRGWSRYSKGSVLDAARRLAAEASVLYAREVTPRLRYSLSRYRQADIQGACRRAWSITLLTAIRLTDECAATVARLYVREVAPRLRRAAARYQHADFEGTFRRGIVAVAQPPRSNASQLR